jgi:hypothetical protein
MSTAVSAPAASAISKISSRSRRWALPVRGSVYGMDESGEMSAVGPGWVVMEPEGNRPRILQKAGGFCGQFSYLASTPHRNVGDLVSINQYDFTAAMNMAGVLNELIAQLAPRWRQASPAYDRQIRLKFRRCQVHVGRRSARLR